MPQRTIEPYRDETLPERFLRWIETIRARFKTIPNFTEFDGSPEGVIFGQKADSYYDLTADVQYVKTTDSGNTGWVQCWPSASGGFQGLGSWAYRTAVAAFPTTGRMQFDNVTIGSATEMYVNEVNGGGFDVSAFLAMIVSGDLMYVQVTNDSSKFAIVEVDTPVLNADVWTFPILTISGQGGSISQNTSVSIVVAGGGGGGGGIAPGTVTNAMLRWSGSAWVETTGVRSRFAGVQILEIEGSGAHLQLWTTGAGVDEKRAGMKMDNFAGWAIQAFSDTGFNGPFLMTANRTGTAWQNLQIATNEEIFGSLYLDDAAGVQPNILTQGQLYVDSADDSLHYRTGAGVDFDLTAAGGAPGGATTQVQYNDAGAFAGDAAFVWDNVAKRITIDKTGGTGAGLIITAIPSNTPAIQTGIGGSSGSNIPLKMFDNSGTQFFQWFFDTSLSTGNHKLELQSNSVGVTPFIEFDNSGEMTLGGAQNQGCLQIQGIGGTEYMIVLANGNGGLYMQEQSAQGIFGSGESQWWIRNDAPGVPMVTDDTGVRQELDPSYSRIVDFSGDTTLTIFSKGLTMRYTGAVVAQTLTIPANASVAYRLGAWIAVDNDGTVDISIAITTDTMTGTDGATGTRTLGPDQRALMQKLTATTWRYQASDL